LADLHKGAGLPIVPLLLGLPNTQQELQETIAVSRYSDGNEPFMVGLNEDESREYVTGMFDWLKVKGTDRLRSRLCDWLTRACGGWPHHLSNGMKAVAEGLLAADSMALADLDGHRVTRSLTSRRLRYCHARMRLKPELEASRTAIGELLSRLPIPEGALHGMVRDVLKRNEPEWEVCAEKLVEALQKSGIVARETVDGGGFETVQWTCPMQSMGDFAVHGTHQIKPFPDLSD